jgi:hypothetical protein
MCTDQTKTTKSGEKGLYAMRKYHGQKRYVFGAGLPTCVGLVPIKKSKGNSRD